MRSQTTLWQPPEGDPFPAKIVWPENIERFMGARGPRLIKHLRDLRDRGHLVVPPKAKRLQCQVKIEDESDPRGFRFQRAYVFRGTRDADIPPAPKRVWVGYGRADRVPLSPTDRHPLQPPSYHGTRSNSRPLPERLTPEPRRTRDAVY